VRKIKSFLTLSIIVVVIFVAILPVLVSFAAVIGVNTPAEESGTPPLPDGALVMDAGTGEVLYLHNPSIVVEKSFSPGSTLKVFSALYALKEDITRSSTVVQCKGSVTIDDKKIDCWFRPGHGSVDLYKALAYSCNIYFYEAARRFDFPAFFQFLRSFGFGRKTRINLPNENTGSIPLASEMPRVEKIEAAAGNTDAIKITPLQLAVAFSAVVNGGSIVKPFIKTGIQNEREREIEVEKEKVDGIADHLPLLHDALTQGSTFGTSEGYHSLTGGFAKTGTAPFNNGLRTHAWFVGTVPLPHRTLVVVVFMMDGTGNKDALPIGLRLAVEWKNRLTDSTPVTVSLFSLLKPRQLTIDAPSISIVLKKDPSDPSSVSGIGSDSVSNVSSVSNVNSSTSVSNVNSPTSVSSVSSVAKKNQTTQGSPVAKSNFYPDSTGNGSEIEKKGRSVELALLPNGNIRVLLDGKETGTWGQIDIRSIDPVGLVRVKQEKLEDRYYPGTLFVSIAGTDDCLEVINSISLREYLMGVIGNEMGPFEEAMKAQAVASRTYALKNLRRHGNYDFCDTTHCQHYTGLPLPKDSNILSEPFCKRVPTPPKTFINNNNRLGGIELSTSPGKPGVGVSIEKIEKAVEETGGLVLMYMFPPPTNNLNKINNQKLLGVQDPFHEKGPGRRRQSLSTLCEIYYHSTCGGFTNDYDGVWEDRSVPYLKSVDDAGRCARSPHYRWSFEIETRSLMEIVGELVQEVPVDIEIREISTGGWVKLIAAIMADGREVLMNGEEFHILMGRRLGWNKVKSANFVVRKGSRNIVFFGRGLGHGVGMCQWGARGMAEKGVGYREILSTYFPGVIFDYYTSHY